MFVLVTYDVATTTPEGRRRLRRLARVCLNYGQRVQMSVFEVTLGDTQLVSFRHELVAEINPSEDSAVTVHSGQRPMAIRRWRPANR